MMKLDPETIAELLMEKYGERVLEEVREVLDLGLKALKYQLKLKAGLDPKDP